MRVRWKYPDLEDDESIHLTGHDIERTLCGMAEEGCQDHSYADRDRAFNQALVPTTKKATCELCFAIWSHCQSIKRTEFKEKTNA